MSPPIPFILSEMVDPIQPDMGYPENVEDMVRSRFLKVRESRMLTFNNKYFIFIFNNIY